MLHVLPGQPRKPNMVNGRYEEGRDLDLFVADLWMACNADLPDCSGQLLRTIKECFRQILKVSLPSFETHTASWVQDKPNLSGLEQAPNLGRLDRPDSEWMFV